MGHAFGDAATAIAQTKGPCRDFFTQGRSFEEVSKIFANFWQTASYDHTLQKAMAVTTNSGQGMAASVALGSTFFSDTDSRVYEWSPVNNRLLEKATNLTPRQYRALTILHEFAHALGLIPRDNERVDPRGRQSIENDEFLYRKCGAVIEAAVPENN